MTISDTVHCSFKPTSTQPPSCPHQSLSPDSCFQPVTRHTRNPLYHNKSTSRNQFLKSHETQPPQLQLSNPPPQGLRNDTQRHPLQRPPRPSPSPPARPHSKRMPMRLRLPSMSCSSISRRRRSGLCFWMLSWDSWL